MRGGFGACCYCARRTAESERGIETDVSRRQNDPISEDIRLTLYSKHYAAPILVTRGAARGLHDGQGSWARARRHSEQGLSTHKDV